MIKKLLSVLFISLLLTASFSWAIKSNSEGVLDKAHDQSMQVYRNQYFYDNQGKIDPVKLQSLKSFLLKQKDSLRDSAYLSKKMNLIEVHGYSEEKGTESGTDALDQEAQAYAPILFALEYTEDLIKNYATYPAEVLHEKVETTLLWIAAGYTIHPEGLFSRFYNRLQNLLENFFEFGINDSDKLQASNLLKDGKFLPQEALKKLRLSGVDISKFDPPTSSIWENSEIEKYNPQNEIYWGKKLFPDVSVQVPVFHYSRMGNGTIKFKTHWYDPSVLTKKGKPTKKSVTIRVGTESYTNSVVNHMARIIGYRATPTTFRSKVKLELGDTNFEEFLNQWKRVHQLEQGSALTHIERIPGENAVYLKNTTLEGYPDDDEYRKIAPFRMGDNGLKNRREYRAMVLYNSLISLQDHFEYQSRVDAYKDPITKEWKPLFYIADTSSALGLPALFGSPGTVNEFTWEFTKKLSEKIYLFWFSVFDHRTWEDTTYSDVKWAARRIARISSEQIDLIMKTSGFPAPAQALFAEKFKSRINRMIIDFNLTKEGFRLHSVKSIHELVRAYPQYIDNKGYLKENAQEYPGNTLPILGFDFTPYQALISSSLNAFQNTLLDFVTSGSSMTGAKTFDLGQVKSNNGLLFGAKRDVSVNHEGGPGQKRYLLKDTYSISIPIGFNNDRVTTPLAFYYTYSFEYFHSVTTLKDTVKSRFFASMNPFDLSNIKRNLKIGEQLLVTHSTGASAGNLKVKAADDLKFEAALFNVSYDRIKTIYFSKPSENILEIASDIKSQNNFKNGIDIKALVSIGLMFGTHNLDSEYRLYRMDLINEPAAKQELMAAAFQDALVYNDFRNLNKLATPLSLDEKAKQRFFNLNLFFWALASSNSVHEFKVNQDYVYTARESKSQDRAFDRLWNDKINPKAAKGMVNYFGNFWNEGEALVINFEGKANSQISNFESSELTLSFSKVDNYCTRAEFENDFKPYFNSKSGQDKYVDFKMPQGLDVYPELVGQMKWQLNSKAIRQILIAATDWKHLEHLEIKDLTSHNQSHQDPREVVSYRATRALESLKSSIPLDKKRALLKEKAQDINFVIKSLIGENGERVRVLRSFVSDQDIWIITSMSMLLDYSHPSFNSKKDDLFYAPEIGKFQGFSFLENFRRKNLTQPILVQ